MILHHLNEEDDLSAQMDALCLEVKVGAHGGWGRGVEFHGNIPALTATLSDPRGKHKDSHPVLCLSLSLTITPLRPQMKLFTSNQLSACTPPPPPPLSSSILTSHINIFTYTLHLLNSLISSLPSSLTRSPPSLCSRCRLPPPPPPPPFIMTIKGQNQALWPCCFPLSRSLFT